ncbi:Glutamate receptor ionotropic [Blattella germanica]|nr:Glutamate receptor ionotropic [Blattella germanica]
MAIRLFLLLITLVSGIICEHIKIGGLFFNTEQDEKKVFHLTAEGITITSNNSKLVARSQLVALPEYVESHDCLKVSQTVCELLEMGIAGVFGPSTGPISHHVQTICDTKDIPHIETNWDTKQQRQDFLVNLYPHHSTLASATKVVTTWEWDTFTILYEDSSGLIRLSRLLKLFNRKGKAVTVRQLDSLHNHRPVLREIRNSGEKNIVLDCSTQSLPGVLKQAQQDLHTIDLEPYQHGDTNITGFRMVNPENEIVINTVKHWADVELRRGNLLHITPRKGQSTLKGLSGLIKFDNEGFRTNIMVDIMELTRHGLQRVGSWNSTEGFNMTRAQPAISFHESENFMNRTFKVITALAEPYTMRRRSSIPLKGNERFEGFAIDLIYELSQILGFNYTFTLQQDKQYDGMLEKLRNNTADLAIVDLTITSHRESVVDFTMPFMNLGISILYKRPTKEAPSLFSFMSPFSNDVWLCMMCPYEWTNPYPCIEEPDELENQFTLRNSLWFTIGSLMQQGSEIAPIMTSPFKNVKELANQNVIKYGAKTGGSTVNFFRDSGDPMYQRMYQYMMDNAGEVLTSSNEEGLEWVKTKNYAFLMESTSIEYFTERHCEVAQVGDLLDAKGYGIAMRKNSTYRNVLSTAVLKLQESGKLSKLKTKWWKEERGGGKCSETRSSGNPSSLNLQNVGGVFVVLVAGLIMACLIALLELLCHICEISRREKVPFREELSAELKFITRCHGSTKRIRKYNHNKDSPHPGDSHEFIHMSIYGSSPYGLNNTIKEPL